MCSSSARQQMAVFGLWCWGEERQQPPAKEEAALIMDLTLGADSSLSCKWAVVPVVGWRHGVSPLNSRLTAFYMYITGIQQMCRVAVWKHFFLSVFHTRKPSHSIYFIKTGWKGQKGHKASEEKVREVRIRDTAN